MKNYVVHFTDEEDVDVHLGLDTLWDPTASEAAPRDSWVLLEERPLGDDIEAMAAAGNLHKPAACGRGRPRETRYAPFAGPTARRQKK